jgi:hypothetical protein
MYLGFEEQAPALELFAVTASYRQRPDLGGLPAYRLPDPFIGGEVLEELVTAEGPLTILVAAFADELGDVGVIRGVRIIEVPVIGLGALQGVVLNADEVVDDVVRNEMLLGHELSVVAYPLGLPPRAEAKPQSVDGPMPSAIPTLMEAQEIER